MLLEYCIPMKFLRLNVSHAAITWAGVPFAKVLLSWRTFDSAKRMVNSSTLPSFKGVLSLSRGGRRELMALREVYAKYGNR